MVMFMISGVLLSEAGHDVTLDERARVAETRYALVVVAAAAAAALMLVLVLVLLIFVVVTLPHRYNRRLELKKIRNIRAQM